MEKDKNEHTSKDTSDEVMEQINSLWKNVNDLILGFSDTKSISTTWKCEIDTKFQFISNTFLDMKARLNNLEGKFVHFGQILNEVNELRHFKDQANQTIFIMNYRMEEILKVIHRLEDINDALHITQTLKCNEELQRAWNRQNQLLYQYQ
jgi:hypothetical protein